MKRSVRLEQTRPFACRADTGGPVGAAKRGLRWVWQASVSLAGRLSLFQRFMLLSLVILLVGAYVIGSYVSGEIKDRVIQRTSALTALYVDSFVSPHIQELGDNHEIAPGHFEDLDRLLATTSLGQEIVAFKIWHTDGDIVYSNEPELVGRRFPVEGGLKEALSGNLATEMSDLGDDENVLERLRFGKLLETYAPIRSEDSGEVIAVSEFYEDPAELEAEISSSQQKGWLIVGGSTAVMYLLLVGMVRGASNTIASQHGRLEQLARQNADLADRVSRAAAQKSETDEMLLKRVAQDLHDGPAQDVSLALLRLESVSAARQETPAAQGAQGDVDLMRTALAAALKELREISSGLRLPELESMSLGDAVERAAQEHRDKTGDQVRVAIAPGEGWASLPVKIALYRVTQEALNNAHLHAGVTEEDVDLRIAGRTVHLEVRDKGAGLDEAAGAATQGLDRIPLGVRGMRERIEMLGGSLEVSSRTGEGTTVRVVLALPPEDAGG